MREIASPVRTAVPAGPSRSAPLVAGWPRRGALVVGASQFAAAFARFDLIRAAAFGLLVLPTFAALIYYGLIASDRYVSEARFVVRGAAAPAPAGLDLLFRGLGLARATDDAHAVAEFMRSRDALRDLEARLPVRSMFGASGINRLARFPPPFREPSFETLFEIYRDRVSVVEHAGSGVSTLTVTAFHPADAQHIAEALLSSAEDMVNRMNQRMLDDVVTASARDVAIATQRVVDAQGALAAFRNREAMMDPGARSSSALGLIAGLSSERIAATARLEQMTRAAPLSPGLGPLRARLSALQGQIAAERAKLAGGHDALAGKVQSYDRLTLMRDLADRALREAMDVHERARRDAERQRIYLEPVVRPNLPDLATEPQRLRSVATVLACGLMAFALVWILTVGTREHAR